MLKIFIAAILFGLVHPGSKLILDQGLDLLSFCGLYVLIRLLSQLPIVIKTRSYRVKNIKSWMLLISLGVVGAGLQWNEFKGIGSGLGVPTVTFLVYSHPIWSLLFSRIINKEGLNLISFLKLATGLLGIFCILGSEIHFTSQKLQLMISPLFAGVLIALWVSVSNKAKSNGLLTWTLSFYYDFFAFLSLLFIKVTQPDSSMSWGQILQWTAQLDHLLEISFYAIFVGLLPNILFYEGNSTSSARAAGLILLIEPLVATLVSHWIWHDTLSRSFLIGGLFLIVSGAPIEILKGLKLKSQFETFILKSKSS